MLSHRALPRPSSSTHCQPSMPRWPAAALYPLCGSSVCLLLVQDDGGAILVHYYIMCFSYVARKHQSPTRHAQGNMRQPRSDVIILSLASILLTCPFMDRCWCVVCRGSADQRHGLLGCGGWPHHRAALRHPVLRAQHLVSSPSVARQPPPCKHRLTLLYCMPCVWLDSAWSYIIGTISGTSDTSEQPRAPVQAPCLVWRRVAQPRLTAGVWLWHMGCAGLFVSADETIAASHELMQSVVRFIKNNVSHMNLHTRNAHALHRPKPPPDDCLGPPACICA